jgi:beta-galactosidase
MRRTSFNEDWRVRPKANQFMERMAGDTGESVTLPHDAVIGTTRLASADPAVGHFPPGAWLYEKQFDVAAEDAGTSIFLEFEGIYRDALVYINGNFVAHRPYGYSGFTVQVDPYLRFGQPNTVAVEARIHDDSRWYSGAGIYRDVWLLQADRVQLVPSGIKVATPEIDDSVAVVVVSADVRNQSTGAAQPVVAVEITDVEGRVVAHGETPVSTIAGECLTVRQRVFIAQPRRWNLDDPYLYRCRVTLTGAGDLAEEEVTTFGIRTLAVDPIHGLRINGEPVLLRGACIHHDNGVIGAATIGRADERRIEILKDAGFNAIRSAHNPCSVALLDACDRLGMLVMDETFDAWTKSKNVDDYAIRFEECWEADTEAMVAKDFNHPSVIIYSIGNEIPEVGDPAGAATGRRLAEKVRSLDDTRFVTQAFSGLLVGGAELFEELRGEPPSAEPAQEVDARTEVNTAMTTLAERMDGISLSPVIGRKSVETLSYLDVSGYNYMDVRFEMDGQQFPNRVLIGTETHPAIIDRGWASVLAHPHVIGDFVWTGWDYLGEAGIGRIEYGTTTNELGMTGFLGEFPWLTAWCGDIDITGHRRPQSYYREIVFGLRDDPYVAVRPNPPDGQVVVHSSPWSWSDVISSWTWDVKPGWTMVVEVYGTGDEVELFHNGTSVGTKPIGPDHRFRCEFEVDFEAGELEAVSRRAGTEVGRMRLRSASGGVLLRAEADRTETTADGSALSYVTLSLVDEDGVLFTSTDRPITIDIDGPGNLQGFGSADPTSEESFTDNVCTTFAGRALAVIRPTGSGVITLTARAEGCEAQTVVIAVAS